MSSLIFMLILFSGFMMLDLFMMLVSNLMLGVSKMNSLMLNTFVNLLMILFLLALLMGLLFNLPMVGVSLLLVLMYSYCSWFVSVFLFLNSTLHYHLNGWAMLLVVFLFDLFIMILRPITLMLRVIINITLGHFLILSLHMMISSLLIMVVLFEVFVYMVQSFVFLTLTKSYMV